MTSIRRQLTWKLLVAFSVPLVIGGLAIFLTARNSLLEEFDSTLHAKALAVASATHLSGERIEVDTSTRALRDFAAPDPSEAHERGGDAENDDSDIAFFEIFRLDRSVIARSESLKGADLTWTPVTASSEDPQSWTATLPAGRAGRALGFRFRARAATGGADAPRSESLVLIVAADRRELDRTLAMLGLVLAAVGGVTLAAVTLVVPRVLRRELAPLDALGAQAANITAASLSTRFSTDRLPGELVPIGTRLNDLLARLEASFDRERQFSGDLAHELRTPIAELRSLAEVALKWPDTRTSDTDREALAIAAQLEGIVTKLLALLRTERGQLPIERSAVDLGVEIEHVGLSCGPRADLRRVRLVRNVPAKAPVETDAIILRSILTNLVENAIEYVPEQGVVEVDASVGASAFAIRVTNDAPDLRPEDLPRLFDRFWRRSDSRTDNEHSGLGLSIARAFAQVIGAELTATLANGRVTFTLSGRSILAA